MNGVNYTQLDLPSVFRAKKALYLEKYGLVKTSN